MSRLNHPQWRKACLRVDEAASLLERTRKSAEPNVWAARDRWAGASRRWLEGSGSIDEVLEAAGHFAATAESPIWSPDGSKGQ